LNDDNMFRCPVCTADSMIVGRSINRYTLRFIDYTCTCCPYQWCVAVDSAHPIQCEIWEGMRLIPVRIIVASGIPVETDKVYQYPGLRIKTS
jgi:hypothetical protein